jgi:hypothetical protein
VRASTKIPGVDEGPPISYLALEHHVPVYDNGGAEVGSVDHVVAAPEKDIFHGLVISTGTRQCFIAAEDVQSLHERGVDLKIDLAAVAQAPEPHGGAPSWHDREPGVKPSAWHHILDLLSGKDPRSRNWTREE